MESSPFLDQCGGRGSNAKKEKSHMCMRLWIIAQNSSSSSSRHVCDRDILLLPPQEKRKYVVAEPPLSEKIYSVQQEKNSNTIFIFRLLQRFQFSILYPPPSIKVFLYSFEMTVLICFDDPIMSLFPPPPLPLSPSLSLRWDHAFFFTLHEHKMGRATLRGTSKQQIAMAT